MKTSLIILLLFLLQLSMNQLGAQTFQNDNSGSSLNPDKSILFGKDIVLYDSSSMDQRELAVCSAFNGWLYAIFTSYDSINSEPYFSLLKSTDDGITWYCLYCADYGSQYTRLKSNNIIAIGDSISDLKIFWSGMFQAQPYSLGGGFVHRFNGETGAYEDQIYSAGVTGIAMASDYNYQASNSTHPTLGLISSTPTYIAFHSSSNGGISFDGSLVIATSSNSYFHKVALNYGRSPSYPSGRYFAAWEDQENQFSNLGHIYSAHSEPNFNSPFTTPVCLDSLDASAINKVRNPSIACQFSDADNSSGNLTEMVIFEKYLTVSNSYDLKGFYNLQATNSSSFNNLSISTSSNNKLQPSVNFNPYSSTFMLTYFDSTEKKLPFLTNDVNLATPNSWNVISPAYNDNSNLVAPCPKVNLNFGHQNGMNVWISEGTGGNGVALFDAQFLFPTGVSENSIGTSAKLIGFFPNPCNTILNIAFELKNTGKVTIDLMNIMGQPLGTVTDQYYPEGKHIVQYKVSDFREGTYLYNFRSEDFTSSGKILVIR